MVEKLDLVNTTELARQQTDLFSEYVSIRANDTACSIQGAEVLKRKVQADKKLFGEDSAHVANDYKAMDKDCQDAGIKLGVNEKNFRAQDIETAKEAAAMSRTLSSDKDDAATSVYSGREYQNTYIDLFDKYTHFRGNNQFEQCAEILRQKTSVDKAEFGRTSNNLANSYQAMGRDLSEAGSFKRSAEAYLSAKHIYDARNDETFSILSGLNAARSFKSACEYAAAEPLYRKGASYYDNLEKELDMPGDIKVSSPRLRGELGHCLLNQGKFEEACEELTQALKDSRQGLGDIIPKSAIPILQDLSELKSIEQKPAEAAQYKKLLDETKKRYE